MWTYACAAQHLRCTPFCSQSETARIGVTPGWKFSFLVTPNLLLALKELRGHRKFGSRYSKLAFAGYVFLNSITDLKRYIKISRM